MTRDSYRVHEDRGSQNDADIFAALSRTVGSFPRLPDDAPVELRDFVVEIDDPKRVYAVYRASRRHNFQLLVEKYIHQIRYGCLSKACTTVTCFSCRRRLANGAPIRRYNATSARTLAIYMASQDNPDQGLCRNTIAPKPLAPKPKPMPSYKRRSVQEIKDHIKAVIVTAEADDRSNSERLNHIPAKQQALRKHSPELLIMDEPSNLDPKSFVQNMFGTVAFKMVEWLTPRHFDILIKSSDNTPSVPRDLLKSPQTDGLENTIDNHPPEVPSYPQQEPPNPPLRHGNDQATRDGMEPQMATKPHGSSSPPVPMLSGQMPHLHESGLSPDSDDRHTSVSRVRPTTKHSMETLSSKAILSKVLKPSNPDTTHHPRQYPPVQRKLSRKFSNNSSGGGDEEFMVHTSQEAGIIARTINAKPCSDESKDNENKIQIPNLHNASEECAKREGEITKPIEVNFPSLPQSLSYLSIELIEFLCATLENDGTAEAHTLHPPEDDQSPGGKSIHKSLRRLTKSAAGGAHASKHAWKLFIEQSLFDILSRPDSVLRSFRNDQGSLLDTQTIWHLMLQLTTVAPSLVLDSLWKLAGTLFQPVTSLQPLKISTKEDTKHVLSEMVISNHDAGELITICLHALVATVPLASKQELASMSRIRSYGLVTRGSESASQDLITLCLQYNDAFTNDLSVRLARRVFSAIPARRRLADLSDSQNKTESGEKSDLLETIINSLKSLDLGSETALPFTEEERDIHEKRMPILILDWARAVMLQEWQGAATVPTDGPLGGALATIDILYRNRKALLLGDIHFRTEYFAERLDPVEMPSTWLSFQRNTRTTHLLDYPYLFNPSTLVTYFRAINFSRMNRAYESAKATSGLMYSTMAESSLMPHKNRREQLYRRLEVATTKFNVLEIGRTDVLKDTFNAIWRREERELLRPLKVRLGHKDGDEGMDSGGVQQEFFRMAIAEAVNPDYGAFTIDDRTRMCWFQPGSPEPLWKFELIGMIVSLAIYNGLTLPITFPKALYMKLLDEGVSELHHIEDGWTDTAKSLTLLLEWDEKDGAVEDIFVLSYEFSADLFGKPISCEMGTTDQWPQFTDSPPPSNPDAPMVTNENRNNYVSDYIRWMTDVSIRPQFEEFRKGFFSCIDRHSISLFDADTLQSIVEGIQEIDIPEMRRATNYVGWRASHRTVRDFWSIVKRYTLEQKRKLLEFTTASDRVPVGGMKNLQFTLQKNGVDDEHLPTSYTCYGILLLPEYSSKEVLREKLAMALENSKGFGFA